MPITSGGGDDRPDTMTCSIPRDEIEGNGRIIVRLAGNVVKEVIKTKKGKRFQWCR